jgi:hypothetical protein
MATVERESRFIPTVKCSTCGLQVEISLMGEHVCAGSQDAECTVPVTRYTSLYGGTNSASLATPPLLAVPLLGKLISTFGNPPTEKQQPRALPRVDTSAASM